MIHAPWSNNVLLLILLILLVFASGCAEKTTVVLLPDPDGKVGHITVSNGTGSIDIDKAREATTIQGQDSQPTSPKILSPEAIDADFSPVLTILPSQPVHFILYFQEGSNDLTAESRQTLPAIFESINSRKSQHISVIGHTDTVGDRQYNLRLSKERAAAIRRLLVQQGVPANTITSTSHGQENLLIKTADNVNEPRNRRVEVVVK